MAESPDGGDAKSHSTTMPATTLRRSSRRHERIIGHAINESNCESLDVSHIRSP